VDFTALRLMGDRFDYVDDVAVAEADDDAAAVAEAMSARLTWIAVSSREQADQNMAKKKCKILPLQPAASVGKTTAEDVAALGLKHQCKCGEPFASVWGLRVHSRTCPAAQEQFEQDVDGDEYQDVEELLDVRGPPDNRYWRVKWAGKNAETGAELWPDRGTGNGLTDYWWQAERNLSVGLVDMQNEFWRVSGKDRRGENTVEGEIRCERCNQIFATAAAQKRHEAKPTKANKAFVCKKRERVRKFKGTEVDRLVQRAKRAALLNELPWVIMEGVQLKYELEVEYLGHMFQGDGGCDVDVARRLAIARSKFNQLGWLWRSKQMSEGLKFQFFESLVLSSVVWGSEGWLLTEAVQRKLNGWCSRCVSIITGEEPAKEASSRTQQYCLPRLIRSRRMAALGHFLRADGGDLTRQALLRYAELHLRKHLDVEGSILMDGLAYMSVDQLVWLEGGGG